MHGARLFIFIAIARLRTQCEQMSCFLLGKVYLYIANLCMTILILIFVLQIDVLFANIRQSVKEFMGKVELVTNAFLNCFVCILWHDMCEISPVYFSFGLCFHCHKQISKVLSLFLEQKYCGLQMASMNCVSYHIVRKWLLDIIPAKFKMDPLIFRI